MYWYFNRKWRLSKLLKVLYLAELTALRAGLEHLHVIFS